MTGRQASREAPARVDLVGGGVAAACCAHLLGNAGIACHWQRGTRSAVPALMLSDPARTLLRDVMDAPTLFETNARIERRVVVWGGGEPVTMPHGAVMLGAGELELELPGTQAAATGRPGTKASFTIHTDAPPPGTGITRYGDRRGETVPVTLREVADAHTCWIEAVESGWMFMIPSGDEGRGWLLAIGGPLSRLLGESRHLAARVEPDGTPPRSFDTTPRMLDAFCAQDWLACGSRSMAFDPICGDGTALAVRQALLVSAVVRAAQEGEDTDALFGHYRAMMIAAMRRHLRLCAQFYASGGEGAWWQAQRAAIAEGFAACTALLEREPEPRFVLDGTRLIRKGNSQ